MKKSYKKLMGLWFILAACCLFYVPGNAQTTLSLDGYGEFPLHPTQYGDAIGIGDTVTGEIAFLFNEEGDFLGDGCETFDEDYTDKIVVIGVGFEEQDTCGSAVKVGNAQEAGAKALIMVVNSTFPTNYRDVGNIGTIPTFVMRISEATPIIDNFAEITSAEIYYLYDDFEEILWEEDFAEGFNGPRGEWTSVNTIGASDTMVWKYSPTGISNGWFRTFMLNSPTRGNGVAIMDNGAYLSQNGTVEPPFDSRTGYGETGAALISPIIDLSDSDAVTVKWWQYAAGLNFKGDGFVRFSYSTDGGVTWSAEIFTQNNSTVNQGLVYNPEIVRVFIPDIGKTSEFRFKIEFRSDLYMMMVDDIHLVTPVSTDLAVAETPFYTPINFMQPSFAIEHDEFFFQVNVVNNGAEAQKNISLKAEIVDLSDNSILATIEGVSDAVIPVGESEIVSISETYFPEGLAPGTYEIHYTVIPEEPDMFPGNNTASIKFMVSDNTFSQTQPDPNINSWYVGDPGETVAVGNVYTIPAEVEDNYKVGNINVSYRNPNSVDVTGRSLNVVITQVPTTIAPDWSNWDFGWGEDPVNLQEITQIAFQEIYLDDTADGSLITASGDGFIDFEFNEMENVPLENGMRYIIWNMSSDSDIGVGLSATYQIINPPAPFIYSGGESRYYSYFSSGTQAVVELELQLVTTVDDIPLPEEVMTVYPNPVTGTQLYTDLSFENATNATITIADMNGIVQSFKVHKNVVQQTIETDVSNLTAGMYIVRLATKDGTRTVKFIKQ